ncbi:HEAT repeat domain-containing protein [Actinosynnema sp. NPDC050801]|uniref:nSTAND1 domain-containing NTPase n=1 Tax=unclassified Actinosynnema TaxID=2637065 RepID=UPI0033E9B398
MRRVRVFLSSPGDVRDERAVALEVLDRLRYDHDLRGRVDFEVVAWDRAGAGTPILATRTPQASIDEGLPRPSECDVVVVLFWSRMGTPLPHPEYLKDNGEPYLSGTEWEFEDAVRGAGARGTPAVLLYRRVPMAPLDPDRHDAEERWRQARAVREFFERRRDPSTGAILGGHKECRTPDAFRVEFEADLRALVGRLIAANPRAGGTPAPPLWDGSPFPGLRAFTPRDAPIYFGRGREVDELLARLAESRFLAVVGASGSGKSSLVGAGLIPRLAAGALGGGTLGGGWLLPDHDPATNQWTGLRITPGELGDNPFLALAVKLAPLVGGTARDIAADLRRVPGSLAGYLGRASAGRERALLFVDQFEELFTTVDAEHVEPFLDLLRTTTAHVVVTVRSDFYHRCVAIPALADLLAGGQFPLSAPRDTLFDMIVRPAERAGLDFEEGLAGRILADTGRDPGALPLLAYTLDELYRTRGATRTLSHEAYQRLGGVRGAVGTRAEGVFRDLLDDDTRATFTRVFRELSDIDESGLPVRRRVALDRIAVDEHTRRFVDVFTEARLFVRSAGPAQRPLVSVAHEALFAGWTRLREWIEVIKDDLRLLRRVRAAAREWEESGRAEAYLWQHERLAPVYETLERLEPAADTVPADFLRPEHERLLPTFLDPTIPTYRRQALTDRLVSIGTAAIPGLLGALRSPHVAVRTSAGTALVRIGEAAVPGLVDRARDPEPEVRLTALGALRQLDHPGAVPTFATALRDDDERVRSLTFGALTAVGSPEAVAALTDAMSDADLDVRWRAVGALGAFGEAAVGPLLLSMGDADRRVRAGASAALEAIAQSYPDPLVDALRDPDPRLRAAAAEVLAEVDATTGLVRALGDDDVDVRWRAAEVLAARGGDPGAVPALLTALVDDHPAVRRAAARALGGHADATTGLVTALADVDAEVAEQAARSLARIGEPAVDPLIPVLKSDDPLVVRTRAAKALAASGSKGITVLLAFGGDPERWMPAVDALAGRGAEVVPAAARTVRGADRRRRRGAAAVLQAVGDAALPALAELTSDPDASVRRTAVEALGASRSKKAPSMLGRLLRDDDEAVRLAAATALGGFGVTALPLLLRIVERPDVAARTAAGHALRLIGEPAVPELVRLTRMSDNELRGLAVAVLTDIGTPAAVFGLSELGLLPEID